MQRRDFLATAAAAAVASVTVESSVQAQTSVQTGTHATAVGEFYLLRRYQLTRTQSAPCDRYLSEALLPALGRLGFQNIGVFALEYGPQTPATYLLLRHRDPAALLSVDRDLAVDATYRKAAESFQGAAAAQPAFVRKDDTLLQAFAGRPTLQVPAHGKHVLQLRTYESPSEAAHLRKVEMFHSGEFEIFAASGMAGVFYASTVVGERMPSLTYMLSFASLSELEAAWQRFRDNPAWKKLSTDPHFSYEDLVSNISNLVLSPKPYSQW